MKPEHDTLRLSVVVRTDADASALLDLLLDWVNDLPSHIEAIGYELDPDHDPDETATVEHIADASCVDCEPHPCICGHGGDV